MTNPEDRVAGHPEDDHRSAARRHDTTAFEDMTPLDGSDAAADAAVSAVLDGDATPDQMRRVADSPELQARLEAFQRVAERVRVSVPESAETDVERMVHKALAAFDEQPPVEDATQPAVVVPLAAPRQRRQPGRRSREWVVGVAAALVLIIGVVVALAASHRSTNTSATAARSATSAASRETAPADAHAQNSPLAGVAKPVQPSPPGPPSSAPVAAGGSAEATSPSGPASDVVTPTAAPPSNSPSLGTFANVDELMASLSSSMSVPAPGSSPTPQSTTTAPPAGNTGAAAVPQGAVPPTANPPQGGCTAPTGSRSLGTASVGGTLLLVVRDDATGHVVGFDARSCARVFDRSP